MTSEDKAVIRFAWYAAGYPPLHGRSFVAGPCDWCNHPIWACACAEAAWHRARATCEAVGR